jgi:hypothetical protein
LTTFARLAAVAPRFVPLARRALEYATAKITSVDEVMRSLSGLEEAESATSLLDDVLATSGELPAPDGAVGAL